MNSFPRVFDSWLSFHDRQHDLIDSERGASSDLIALYKTPGGGWEEKNFKPAAAR
jgi:hypothetical protein